jgi:formylglycine-generating enzyme required for sulfatase activity
MQGEVLGFSNAYLNQLHQVKTQKKTTKSPKIKSVVKLRAGKKPAPSKPSDKMNGLESIDMVAVKPSDGETSVTNSFLIGKNLVTISEWNATVKWASKNDYIELPHAKGPHEKRPVTDITLREVAKWCNAKSQEEGLKPCYYLDRKIFKSGSPSMSDNHFLVWNTTANGYRIATREEWILAYKAGNEDKIKYLCTRTNPNQPEPAMGGCKTSKTVGKSEPNPFGIYDMTGNVREWVWEFHIYPQKLLEFSRVVGMSYDRDPFKHHILEGDEYSSDFRAKDIGFRLVRKAT